MEKKKPGECLRGPLTIMLGNGDIEVKEQTEQDPLKYVESDGQGDQVEEQSMSSTYDDALDNDTDEVTEGSIVELSALDPDLLKMCRPMSVRIIRLPNSIVNKFVAAADLRVRKKRSQFSWKTGFSERHRRTQYLRRKKMQVLREKAEVLKLFKLTEDEGETGKVENLPFDEQPVSSSESTWVKTNVAEETEKSSELWETTGDERSIFESSITFDNTQSISNAEFHENFQTEPDSTDIQKVSNEIKSHSPTKIIEVSENVTADIPETSPKISRPVSPEQNNNLNTETILQRLVRSNSVTISPVKIRKRLYESDDAKNDETPEHSSKKIKCSESAEFPEEIPSIADSNAVESIASLDPVVENEKTNVGDKSALRFVRRRLVDNILNKSKVVLCKIEDSRDPLVLRWRIKKTLQRLCDVTLTERRTRPTNNGLDESATLDADERLDESQQDYADTSLDDRTDPCNQRETAAPMDVEQADDIGETDEDEDVDEDVDEDEEDDGDDDEIVNFFRDRRKVRPSIDSSSSSGSSPCRKISSRRSSPAQIAAISSSSAEKQSCRRESRRTSLGNLSTESPSSGEMSDRDEVPMTRSRRLAETRKKVGVARRRIISESSSTEDSDGTGSYEEIRRPPSTRRKAFQMAIEASAIDKFNTTDESSGYTIEDSSNSGYDRACYRSRRVRSRNANESATIRRVDDSEIGISNAAACDINGDDAVDADRLTETNGVYGGIGRENSENPDEDTAARKRLTAFRNAMVVLSRMDNLDEPGEDEKYSDDDNELRIVEQLESTRDMSPAIDPLDIDRNDDRNSCRETKVHPVGLVCAVSPRISSKKSPLKNVVAPWMNGEAKAGLEDPGSRGSTERDAEINGNLDEARGPTESQGQVTTMDDGSIGQNLFTIDDNVTAMQLPTIISVRSLAQDPNGADWPGVIVENEDDSGEPSKPNDPVGDRCDNNDKPVDREQVSIKHKCVRCRSTFVDAQSLSNHKNSSVTCRGRYICTICHSTYTSLVALKKHRSLCVDKEIQPQNPTAESTIDGKIPRSQSPATVVNEKSLLISNKNKKQNSKKINKSPRTKNRSRVDNLICGVCSIDFPTTQALAEHIFTHNTDELQKAYLTAKARALDDSAVLVSGTSETRVDDIANPENVGKDASVETVNENGVSLDNESPIQIRGSSIGANVASSEAFTAKPATVCACHRDSASSRPDQTDLQIEMVLLCQQCNVIFRRRECFEIHYRANPGCAIDRTRGRLPKLYCANCQSTLDSWSGMRRHLEIHASLNVEGTVRFVCNICRVVFVGFGALFYNHWSNHLKDNMLVASRYSFPKNAIQPIDSVPKLPIGSAPNEPYILVAEHVCSNCKRPFSTRRDLAMHEKSRMCTSSDENAAKEKDKQLDQSPKLFADYDCSICKKTFTHKRGLTMHKKNQNCRPTKESTAKEGEREPEGGAPESPIASTPDHEIIAKHVCTNCKRPFSTIRDLAMHEKSGLCSTLDENAEEEMEKQSEQPDKLIAEYVCSNCKRTFANRGGLVGHENSGSCRTTEETAPKEKEQHPQWMCDVCYISFSARRGLNRHSKARHGQRYLCVATSPEFQGFMCTRCFGMKRSIKEIEFHWKTQPDHETPLSFIEKSGSAARARAIEECDDSNDPNTEIQISQDPSQATGISQVEIVDFIEKSKSKNPTMIIDITEEDGPSEKDCISETVEKQDEQPTVAIDNPESTNFPLANSGDSVTKLKDAVLRQLLSRDKSDKSDNNEKTKSRALEDPCVNIVLSEISKENVSAKLVIARRQKNATTTKDHEPNMDSYKIVLTKKKSPENTELGLGRTGSNKQSLPRSAIVSAVEANADGSTGNELAAPVVEPRQSTSQLSTKTNFPHQNTVIRSLPVEKSVVADEKENVTFSRIPTMNNTDATILPPPYPEIIDIADEKEESDGKPTASFGNACKLTRIVDQTNVKTLAGSKPVALKPSMKVTTASHSPSKSNSSICSLTSNHSNIHSLVRNTPELSFEEIRYADLIRLKRLPTVNSAAVKKPGFLRVKNLSELQPVNTHNCHACNAAFESYASLEEHHQVHRCNNLVSQSSHCPKRMTAALVLPDHPGGPSNKPLPEVYTTGSVVTQQLIGLDSGMGGVSGVPVSNMFVNNEATGSWIALGNHNNSMSSVAMVNASHGLSGGALLMDFGGQQTTNSRAGAIMATSISTTTATIAHTQELYAMQSNQQPQQQPAMSVMDQQLGNNYNGQFGFHVLPATVTPQQTQGVKQHCNDRPIRNTSTNNLPISGQMNNAPFTYNAERSDRYRCNICTTFSCNSVGTMNSHVMKHYTGFNNTSASQNSTQSGTGLISKGSSLGTTAVTSQNFSSTCKELELNSTGDLVGNSLFLKNTPQGMVWVSSSETMPCQQPGSSVRRKNNQSTEPNNPSQSDHQPNFNSIVSRGCQPVYRCLICRTAIYKAFSGLRDHLVVIHRVIDLTPPGLESVVRKSYICAYCATGAVTYDSEESVRRHVTSCHTHLCSKCGRVFVTPMGLRSHMAYCCPPGDDNPNASGRNCS